MCEKLDNLGFTYYNGEVFYSEAEGEDENV
jgi:hypothetical protein